MQVFIINFPFCVLGFILAFLFVRLNTMAKMTLAQKLKSTDWIGAALFVGGMTSFLIQYKWVSVQTLAPIMIGLIGVVVFVGWQIWMKPKSLLPMSIFYCPSALAAFYCALMSGLVVSSKQSLLPIKLT